MQDLENCGGDSPRRVVFQYPWLEQTIFFGVLFGAATVLAWMKLHSVVITVAFLGIIIRTAMERRRKIIISPEYVEYYPIWGHPSRILLHDVTAVRAADVSRIVFLMPRIEYGAAFDLRNGSTATLPLDMPENEDVLSEIKAAWKRSYGGSLSGG